MGKQPQVLLSLCMIVRDSSQTLPACLGSIQPWVDEIIVVDTGSQDDSRRIAADFGAQVHEFPWIDDFSAARNESLRHAKADWIFWMDADDSIDRVNGAALRALARSPHKPNTLGYVVQVHCPVHGPGNTGGVTIVDHVKLIRNIPQIRFEGRIHEQVLPAIRRLNGTVNWANLFVVHSGADYSLQGKQRKYDRDLRILELDIKDRPDHPFVLFNFGMTYADMGKPAMAEQWLKRCLTVSNPTESHVRKAYALLVACLASQNRYVDAESICRHGLELFPHDMELHFHLGLLSQASGNLHSAIEAYCFILTHCEAQYFKSIDSGIVGHKARHNLAVLYADIGELGLAELHWWAAFEEASGNHTLVNGLAYSLLEQSKLVTLEILVEQVEARGHMPEECLWMRAELAARRGDFSAATDLLEQVLAIDQGHVGARRLYCRIFFERGPLEKAAIQLYELARLVPNDASVYHNLGVVYARQGRTVEAVRVFERSLELRPNWLPTLHELARVNEAQIEAVEITVGEFSSKHTADECRHSHLIECHDHL